jgi:hypothetical protein
VQVTHSPFGPSSLPRRVGCCTPPLTTAASMFTTRTRVPQGVVVSHCLVRGGVVGTEGYAVRPLFCLPPSFVVFGAAVCLPVFVATQQKQQGIPLGVTGTNPCRPHVLGALCGRQPRRRPHCHRVRACCVHTWQHAACLATGRFSPPPPPPPAPTSVTSGYFVSHRAAPTSLQIKRPACQDLGRAEEGVRAHLRQPHGPGASARSSVARTCLLPTALGRVTHGHPPRSSHPLPPPPSLLFRPTRAPPYQGAPLEKAPACPCPLVCCRCGAWRTTPVAPTCAPWRMTVWCSCTKRSNVCKGFLVLTLPVVTPHTVSFSNLPNQPRT